MKIRRMFVLAGLFLAATALFAQTTIRVPWDQATMQAAINAANPGDTVLVWPGTYTENLNFQGKSITVNSVSGPSVTTIAGAAGGPVVTFNSGGASKALLQGFTITGGSCTSITGLGWVGGGIYIGTNETPTIQNNTITQNKGCDAAGIAVNFAGPIIQNNVISFNQQFGMSGGSGGAGIQVGGLSTTPAQIIGNYISDNIHSVSGGGIGLNSAGSVLIKNNFIARNHTLNSGGGISIFNGSSPQMIQNIIVNNAAGDGGGVYWSIPAYPTAILLLNNTIAGNTASQGSALYAGNYGQVAAVVTNNILIGAGNDAVYCPTYLPTIPSFANNDVFVASGTPFTGNCSNQAGQNGNISADPLFVSASADNYRLASASPAIDAGTNAASSLPSSDYYGSLRIVDGSNICTATVDLGAYEFQATAQGNFTPTSLAFGDQLVGTTSNPQPVTLSSAGTTCLQIKGLFTTDNFSQTNSCGTTLPAGQSCTVNVSYSPTVTGTRTGSLALSSNSTSVPSVTLTGNGTGPIASLTPAALSFPAQLLGTPSAPQSLTLSNSGSGTLLINSLSVAGDFQSLNTNCGASVAPGASCTFNIVFIPSARGIRSGTFTLYTNSSTPPATVSLSGTGVAPLASLSANTLTFGSMIVGASSASQTVKLTNTGDAALHISGIAFAGDFAQTNNCPATLATGVFCTLTISFKPTVAGARSGAVTITDDAFNGSSQSVALAGTGVDFAVSATPASATVTTGGTASYTIAVAALGGSFSSTVSLKCSGLPASASCSFSPSSVTPGSTSASATMKVTTAKGKKGTPSGTSVITVTGTSGSLSHSASTSLIVK